jgi:hypothetical protein
MREGGKDSRKCNDGYWSDESATSSQITLTGIGHDRKEKKLRFANDDDSRSISSLDVTAAEYVVPLSTIYMQET